jgi:hypothetical protein
MGVRKEISHQGGCYYLRIAIKHNAVSCGTSWGMELRHGVRANWNPPCCCLNFDLNLPNLEIATLKLRPWVTGVEAQVEGRVDCYRDSTWSNLGPVRCLLRLYTRLECFFHSFHSRLTATITQISNFRVDWKNPTKNYTAQPKSTRQQSKSTGWQSISTPSPTNGEEKKTTGNTEFKRLVVNKVSQKKKIRPTI